MNSDGNHEADRITDSLAVSIQAVRRFRKPLVEYLISGLEDKDKWVRIMAAEMLGPLGDPCSAEYLKPLLTGWDSDLRVVAAKSLAMIQAPRSAYAISQVDTCRDCMIRLVADEALERLKIDGGNARRL